MRTCARTYGAHMRMHVHPYSKDTAPALDRCSSSSYACAPDPNAARRGRAMRRSAADDEHPCAIGAAARPVG